MKHGTTCKEGEAAAEWQINGYNVSCAKQICKLMIDQ